MMRVRVRLGAGLASLAPAPALSLELPDGATVEELLAEVGVAQPQLARALPSVLPVVRCEHADRHRALEHGDEVALLTPISGG
jgi:molybdopterin converting factor small subunit